MDSITLNQSLGLFVAVLALIPIPILINFYLRLKQVDFLLFALVFLFGSIVLIADPLVSITNSLLIIQIHHMSIDIAFFLFFLHGVRIKWNKPPKIILIIGISWVILLIFLTSLWQLMPQPNSAKVLFWVLPHTFSSYYPKGAGLMLSDGTIIYSSAFRYLGELYRLYVIGIILYSYLSLKIFHPTDKIVTARRLWIVIWIFLLMHSIALFFPTITNLVSVFLLIGGLLAVYIVIRIPEGLLLSHAQITRAMKVYEQIKSDNIHNEPGIHTYLEYLQSVNEILMNNASK